jgi:hypothetical protein
VSGPWGLNEPEMHINPPRHGWFRIATRFREGEGMRLNSAILRQRVPDAHERGSVIEESPKSCPRRPNFRDELASSDRCVAVRHPA